MADIDKRAVEDMKLSITALKAGKKGMAIHVISGKTPKEVPWVIVDRAGKAGSRLRAALKIAKGLDTLAPRKVASGRLERHGGHLVVVMSDADHATYGSRVSGAWARALQKADSTVKVGHLKKLAALMKGTATHSESDFALLGASELDDEKRDTATAAGLSSTDLADFFGDDTDEVDTILGELESLNASVSMDDLDGKKGEGLALKAVQRALSGADEDVVNAVASALPLFIGMGASDEVGSTAPVSVGDELDIQDAVRTVGALFAKYLHALTAWEELLEDLVTFNDQLDELDKGIDQDDWEPEDDIVYERTLETYNTTLALSQRGQIQADRLYAQVIATVDQYQGGQT